MTRSLRPYALLALAAVVLGVLENALFGSDGSSTQHAVSVAFFFLAVIGAVALLVVGGVAAVRQVRSAQASR